MPQPAQFEEKEYESLLFHEMLATPGHFWSPGQVLEGKIGFDGAVKVQQSFWRRVGRVPTPGVVLAHTGLGPGLPALSTTGALPNFGLNVFVQVKRSHRYLRRPKKARQAGVAIPCWKFCVDGDQQDLLTVLGSNLQGRAEVCYAAACFDTRDALFQNAIQRTLVPSSAFPLAGSIGKHKVFVYDDSGRGVALSEPQPMKVEALIERVARKWRDGAELDASLDWRSNLNSIWTSAREAFRRSASRQRSWLKTANSFLDELRGDSAEDVVVATSAVLAFAGVLWLVAGPEHAGRWQ